MLNQQEAPMIELFSHPIKKGRELNQKYINNDKQFYAVLK